MPYLLHTTSLLGLSPMETRALAGVTVSVDPKHRNKSALLAFCVAESKTWSSKKSPKFMIVFIR